MEGWLLDVYVQGSDAVLWVKRDDGRVVRLLDRHAPSFYVRPKGWAEEWGLLQELQEHPSVVSSAAESRVTSLEGGPAERLVRVEARGEGFDGLVGDLKRSHLVSSLYGASLTHVQMYLFARLGIEPGSRVSFADDGRRLLWMRKVDEEDAAEPPPFGMMRVEVEYRMEGGRRVLTGARCGAGRMTGRPEEVRRELADRVLDADPDIIALPRCDATFPLIRQERLPREGDGEQVKRQGSWGGRIFIDARVMGHDAEEWGVAGLVERSRFGFVPLGLAAKWLSNKTIDSRNCYELMKGGYAIPEEEYFEPVRGLRELVERDRGGITFTPITGVLHSNVAALDFDSQYPNIMLNGNLSYERPREDPGAPAGLIPTVIGPWLKKRMRLKKLRDGLPKGSRERAYCEQRLDALKLILVCSYGIAGCCWNRFGNVATFEEINRMSREAMLKAKTVAECHGYTLVYGAVDSLFVKKEGAARQDYEALASEIGRRTGLPVSLDRHFRSLAFTNLAGDESSSAMNRYFGVTYDGEVEARGIELRRDDTPPLIKEFQARLILTLMGGEGQPGPAAAERLVAEYVRLIEEGRAEPEGLVVSRSLRKAPEDYKVRVAHGSAALQLLSSGKEVVVGDDIRFVYTDHGHRNPLCRVRADHRSAGYDRGLYVRMLRKAAETVFEGLHGASRPVGEPGLYGAIR
ncbi:MAG: hypothetical protein JRN39_05005 [Nitrososphaerota archaeon]|nr:hypothetical protein [Nitrososphaerota archaeon]MDG6939743.1 hypothetical protein [Nitrososphaerota archaeon]